MMKPSRLLVALLLLTGSAAARLPVFGQASAPSGAPASEAAFTRDFMLDRCDFSTRGRNPFFILEPGYRLVLAGEEDGVEVVLVITVLDETLNVDGVETRVVRERETHDGELVEVSRNYFVICQQTNSVFYFGEDTNIFEDGGVSHEGSWHAGVNGATPGLFMSGTILLGGRYYQERAPGVALDRAEITSQNDIVNTPAGTFRNCLKTRETTALEPGHAETKSYAAGVGVVRDDILLLVNSGFVDDAGEDVAVR